MSNISTTKKTIFALAMAMLVFAGHAFASSDVGFSVVGMNQLINTSTTTQDVTDLVQFIGIASDYCSDASHANAGILTGFDVQLKASAGTNFFIGWVGLYGGSTFFTNFQPVASGGYDGYQIYHFSVAPAIDFSITSNRGFRIEVLGFSGTMPPSCQWVGYWECGVSSSQLSAFRYTGSPTDTFHTTDPICNSESSDAPGSTPSDAYFVLNTLYTPPPSPSVTLTNPVDQQTITSSFDITGTGADFGATGVFVANLYDATTGANVFSSPGSDYVLENEPFTIHVSGIPAGTYNLKFQITNATGNFFAVDPAVQIVVTSNIPAEIGGTPGTPLIISVDPLAYYTAHSDYATPTSFYSNVTGAIAPLVVAIGNWSSSFSAHFAQADAIANGTNFGNGLALINVYSSNINSLFNDFPVSQALMALLVWYLVLAVLASIRFVIKLIK